MKSFNKNSLLFVVAIVFIVSGLCGDFFEHLSWKVSDLIDGIKKGDIYSIADFTDGVDNVTNQDLCYHDMMMDLNSIKENLLGTRIVLKDDAKVVKMDSGSLGNPINNKLSQDELNRIADSVVQLKKVAEDNGSNFLYCAAPGKENYGTYPPNVVSYERENYYNFLHCLEEKDVTYFDFTDYFQKRGMSEEDIFFYTDHHWKPYSGFLAAEAICEELNNRYGYEYNKDYTNINNYNTDTYTDLFLGSLGKKVGKYYTWKGADDFDLIVPGFQTKMIEELPLSNSIRRGSFEDTVLYKQNLDRNYYKVSVYDTYCSGGISLQIFKNENNPDGKKILMVRDSFSQVVVPFLSLQTSELHLCDIRYQDKLNVEEYIQKINPDYVLVLYTGVSGWYGEHTRWNFF